jgi:hypothetical protein
MLRTADGGRLRLDSAGPSSFDGTTSQKMNVKLDALATPFSGVDANASAARE